MRRFTIRCHEQVKSNIRRSVAKAAGIGSFLGLIAGTILVYLAQGILGA